MIVTFCNYKGGTGKTTLTLLLALAFEQVGKRVAILDKDPQATATDAVRTLKQNGLCQITLIDEIQHGFDIIVIDTAPILDHSLLHAVQTSDKVAIVLGQSPNDLWSTQKVLDYIRGYFKPGVEPKLLFNAVKENTILARMIDNVTEKMGAKRYQNHIKDSVSFQTLPLQGWSALTGEQREQVMRMALEIMS